ncbi:hypothetical protein GCM10027600_36690 [Nocardioides ginsengisegetis]
MARGAVPPDDQEHTDDNHGQPYEQFDRANAETTQRRQENDHEGQEGQQTQEKVPYARSIQHGVKPRTSPRY